MMHKGSRKLHRNVMNDVSSLSTFMVKKRTFGSSNMASNSQIDAFVQIRKSVLFSNKRDSASGHYVVSTDSRAA